MRLGLDFDNTIACYDTAFYEVALEQGLVPAGKSLTKSEVKAHLVEAGEGKTWTRLQGLVYGPEIGRAHPFPGVRRFVESATGLGWDVYVVSHKTPVPVLGEPWDLHAAARNWLSEQGFFELGLSHDRLFFEPTRLAKIERLAGLNCEIFVDDLPEVFLEPSFPPEVQQWLHGSAAGPWRSFKDWSEALGWLS